MRAPSARASFPGTTPSTTTAAVGLLTPEALHDGRADEVIAQRQVVLSPAFPRNPERFVRVHPRPPARPAAVWINPPPERAASEQQQHEFMRAGVSKSLTNSEIGSKLDATRDAKINSLAALASFPSVQRRDLLHNFLCSRDIERASREQKIDLRIDVEKYCLHNSTLGQTRPALMTRVGERSQPGSSTPS